MVDMSTGITKENFKLLIEHVGLSAVPEKHRNKVRNLAFFVEDEPSEELRREEGLKDDETLLGFYRGIPHTERGDMYGIGVTFPDAIILFQKPIEEEARETETTVEEIIRETIWHEVAHHFGLDDTEIEKRSV